MKTRSLHLLIALIGTVGFTVPWLVRMAAQDSPIGGYSMSEWAHYQLNVNRTLETGQVGKVIGYTGPGTIGVVTGGEVREAPNNGLWYARRNNEWQNFLPGGGAIDAGTNRLKVAAMAEFRPSSSNGTLIAANTATFIRVNHLFDPDGIVTTINTNTGSFRLKPGDYAVTMVIPVSVVGAAGGNAAIPYTIGLFDLTTTNDIYYQTYTVYDEDLSQYTSVFMPYLKTDGENDYTIRVINHHPTIALRAGQAANVAGTDNHYTEIQFLKLDGIAGLPEAPSNGLLYARSDEDWVSFTPGGGGGAGQDTNAVAAVPDLATLTNSVIGYQKAMVGQTNEATHSLWQRVGLAPTWPAEDWVSVLNGGSVVINADGSGTISGTQPELQVVFYSDSAVIGLPCRLGFYALANEVSVLRNSSMQENAVWATPTNITTEFAYYELTFTAITSTAFTSWRATDSTSDTTTYHHVRCHYGTGPSGEFPNGATILASAAEPGYGWKQVGLESPGGGAVTDAFIAITNSVQTIPLADYVRMAAPTGTSITLTNNNVLADGTADQTLYLMYETYYNDLGSVRIPPDANGTDGIGSNIQRVEGTGDMVFLPRYFYTLRFDGAQSLWMLSAESTLVAEQFPAPWPPPDENGVQLLPAKIRDQLVIELLPYLLTNYARLFPHGLVPGTTANPIVP